MPSFEEQIRGRPALLVHVKLKSADAAEALCGLADEEVMEAQVQAKDTVERIGGEVLGSRWSSGAGAAELGLRRRVQ
jgi:hypothetical protein